MLSSSPLLRVLRVKPRKISPTSKPNKKKPGQSLGINIKDDIAKRCKKLSGQIEAHEAERVNWPQLIVYKLANLLEQEAGSARLGAFYVHPFAQNKKSLGKVLKARDRRNLPQAPLPVSADVPLIQIAIISSTVYPNTSRPRTLTQFTLERSGKDDVPPDTYNLSFQCYVEWISNGAAKTYGRRDMRFWTFLIIFMFAATTRAETNAPMVSAFLHDEGNKEVEVLAQKKKNYPETPYGVRIHLGAVIYTGPIIGPCGYKTPAWTPETHHPDLRVVDVQPNEVHLQWNSGPDAAPRDITLPATPDFQIATGRLLRCALISFSGGIVVR